MILFLYSIFGRILQLLPKFKKIKIFNMETNFYIPVHNHYVILDLIRLKKGIREPKTFEWLMSIPDNSVYFDVGTDYGQEIALLSSLKKNIQTFGFDCSLLPSHYCAVNKEKNNNNFEFISAAISDSTGEILDIRAMSNLSIKSKYSYKFMTLRLDDFSNMKNIYPTHLKIDVDGAELKVIKGSEKLLQGNDLKEIFIEINLNDDEIINFIKSFGFEIALKIPGKKNNQFLFKRN